jgi:hypothetical protein
MIGSSALSKGGPKEAVHLLNRAGFGPRPGQVREVLARGLDAYLDGQLHPVPDPSVDKALQRFKALAFSVADILRVGSPFSEVVEAYETAKLIRAVESKNQLQEALVDFWFNHFNVNAKSPLVLISVLPYERDAIRPHVLGKFGDLLKATAYHPAMLAYLDNYISKKDRVVNGKVLPGLNENYGRELLELHTVGVTAGYTQEDVIQAARCFTGWTIDALDEAHIVPPGRFIFRPEHHDTRAKQVFGLKIAAGGGISDGEKLLDYLAVHPATARFVSRKLVRRFVSDDPPEGLVERCARTFTSTDGDISRVVREIFTSDEFWAPAAARKPKTPLEYVVSALRATGSTVLAAHPGLTWHLDNMGMRPFLCNPPTGYSDRGSDWVSPAYLHRLNFALDLGNGTIQGVVVKLSDVVTHGGADSSAGASVAAFFNREIFGDGLSRRTLETVSGASAGGPSVVAKVAGLVLASPEMQWR